MQKVSVWSKLAEELKEIDPMPWHQAALLGIAFAVMLMMCLYGNYVDELHPSTRSVQEMEL